MYHDPVLISTNKASGAINLFLDHSTGYPTIDIRLWNRYTAGDNSNHVPTAENYITSEKYFLGHTETSDSVPNFSENHKTDNCKSNEVTSLSN